MEVEVNVQLPTVDNDSMEVVVSVTKTIYLKSNLNLNFSLKRKLLGISEKYLFKNHTYGSLLNTTHV